MITTAVAFIATFDPPAFGQACIPVVNGAVVVDGVVAGTNAGVMSMSGCSADPGWGGVVAQSFTPVGNMGLQSAKIFVTGYDAGADGTINKIYVGVHVEGDEQLTDADKLLLVFDANGNGGAAFDASDFAILCAIGSPAPASGEQCNQAAGGVTFFKGPGLPQQALPAGIDAPKVSWDFDPGNDPETEIWETELGIDVTGLGLLAPASGAGFRMGARLIVTQPLGTLVWRWPATVDNDANFNHVDPAGVTGLTPNSLSTTNFGNCGDVIFEPNGMAGVLAEDFNHLPNAFTRLNPSDPTHFNQTTGVALKQNHFQAKVKFYNPSNPADNSPVAVPNVGKVEFFLKPYNSGGPTEFKMGEQGVSFTHMNEIQIKDLYWPLTKADYQAHSAEIASSGHACVRVKLSDFTVNLGTDEVQKNLVYTTASTIRDTFEVSTEGMNLPPGQSEFQYLFRARWRNIPKQLADGWTFKIENADRLKLKPVGKDGNYFQISMGPKEKKLIAIAITGGKMPVSPEVFTISPRAGGKYLPRPSGEAAKEIDVKPGKMVTLISTGSIVVDPKMKRVPNGANGYADNTLAKERFLLPSDFYDPSQTVGALIGSFDQFKTAFVIGNSMTFIIPEKASKLWIAVNDRDGAYDDNQGNGYNVSMIMTDPLYLPTAISAGGSNIAGIPARAQTAANVPELGIEAFNMVPVKGEKEMGMRLEPTGYVAFAVYQSHQDTKGEAPADPTTPAPEPAPTCSCSPSRTGGGYLGLAPILLLVGTGWLYRRSRRGRSGGDGPNEGDRLA